MKSRRGIYLLPNLFTTTSLFAGFYAIVSAMNLQFENAAIAIVFATVMDGLDGPIARLTNTQSYFGAQYDSLSDMVSFGLAPAITLYQWSLLGAGKLGWLVAFAYTASTALRLARFNTQQGSDDKQWFQGLPSTAAALFLASWIWLSEVQDYIVLANMLLFSIPVTILTAVLMVSNLRFYKVDLNIKGPVPFFKIVLLVLLLVFIAIDPPLIIFLSSSIYVFSGLVLTLFWIRRRRIARGGPTND